METKTQQVPGYYVWETQGKQTTVHLSLSVVDRMNLDIMRGFGSVPKRGAEAGGVLLGFVEPAKSGGNPVIRIEDFEAVKCSYARGPSFLLSDEERGRMEDFIETARRKPLLSPVGYFRSHTREGDVSLSGEDLELLDRLLPEPTAIALLVKPFATKVASAGIFVREEGKFPERTALEFPFRRRDLAGEEAPARRPLQDRAPRLSRADHAENTPPPPPPPRVREAPLPEAPRSPLAQPLQHSLPPSLAVPPPPEKRSNWPLLPLCSLFLLVGLAAGFQSALTFAPPQAAPMDASAFRLNLSAGRNGNTLTVRWDRNSPAVRAAGRGVLEIQDGDLAKPVPLDAAHLREGSVVYQNTSPLVQFRLVVYVTPEVTVNEAVEWVQ